MLAGAYAMQPRAWGCMHFELNQCNIILDFLQEARCIEKLGGGCIILDVLHVGV